MKLTKTILILLLTTSAASLSHGEVISEIQNSDGSTIAIPIIIQRPVKTEDIPSTNTRGWISSVQLETVQQELNSLEQLSIEFESTSTEFFEVTKIQLEENSGEIWESTQINHFNRFSSILLSPDNWTLSSFSNRENNFFDKNNIRTIYITTLSETQRTAPFSNNPIVSIQGYTTEQTPVSGQTIETLSINTSAVGVNISSITLDDKSIKNGDYVAPRPKINFHLDSATHPISSWNITIQSETNTYTNSESISTSTQNTLISHTVNTPLSNGIYTLSITAANNNNESSTSNAISFEINTEFALNNVLNSPNPFNPNAELNYIEYQLTQDADVVIMLYSIDGEKQKEWRFDASTAPGGKAGYNSIPWNGVNRFNETVANGIYVAYIIAKNDGKTKKDKTKIMVLK